MEKRFLVSKGDNPPFTATVADIILLLNMTNKNSFVWKIELIKMP